MSAACSTLRVGTSGRTDHRTEPFQDAAFSESYMRKPKELLQRIKMLTGVLEVGLFCDMAVAAFFGLEDGTVLVRYPNGVRHLLNLGDVSLISLS